MSAAPHAASGYGFVLEDPPPRDPHPTGGAGGRGKKAEWIAAAEQFAREHPGSWVRVRSYAYQPRTFVHRFKGLGLDATMRRVDGEYVLYVRCPDPDA